MVGGRILDIFLGPTEQRRSWDDPSSESISNRIIDALSNIPLEIKTVLIPSSPKHMMPPIILEPRTRLPSLWTTRHLQ